LGGSGATASPCGEQWRDEQGVRSRVTVTLATGIPEDVVRSVNLNYLNPADVDIAAYQADPETFVEPHAGEVLYRLRPSASESSRASPMERETDMVELEG
jgi:hypothetical protein